MSVDANALTRAYVKLRDARAELNKQFEAKDTVLKDAQKILENAMLRMMQDSKVESVRTDSGTFYRQEEVTPTGQDWEAFYAWVLEHNAFDALERRIKKTFIKEYMDANDKALPPGVSVFREFVVRVRRS